MTGRGDWASEAPVERTLADEEPVRALPRLDAPAVREPVSVVEQRRPPIDLDAVQETAWAVVGAVLYLLGALASAVTLADAFAPWAGTLVVLAAGAAPAGYSLAKASQRRAERERNRRHDAKQERTNHDATGFDAPGRR